MSGSGSKPPAADLADKPLRATRAWRSNLILAAITLIIIIIISISLLTGSRPQRVYLPMLSAVEDMAFYMSDSHLRLDEFLAGDPGGSVDEVWRYFAAADSSFARLGPDLCGGILFQGDSSEWRRLCEDVRQQLRSFREITAERIAIGDGPAVDHAQEQRYYLAHQRIVAGCHALHSEIQHSMIRSQRRFVALQVGLMLIGVSLSLLLSLISYRYRVREERTLHSLAAGEERLQTLSDASFEAIFISEKGVCLDQNQTAERMFGISREEALGRMGTDWIVPEDREFVKEKMMTGDTTAYQVTALRKNGSTFPAIIQGRMQEVPGRDPIRITALRDISRRREAEVNLRHLFELAPVAIRLEDCSEVKLRLEELARSGVRDWQGYLEENPDLLPELVGLIRTKDVNQTAVTMHEARDKEELIASLTATFTEESLSPFREVVLALLAGETIIEVEGRVQTLNGKPLDVLARVFLDPEAKDWSKVYYAITDVTEIKRITREHQVVEGDRDRLASVIEQAPQTVVITDIHGDIVYVNPGFEVCTGYSRDEVMSRNPRFLASGLHDTKFYEQMWSALSEGSTWRGRLQNRHRDGSLFTEDCVISPIMNSRNEVVNYVAVKQDITREIKLEARLRQSQKLEAVGQLAGGVAHDFNNILQAILGYVDFAKTDLDTDSRRWRDIDEIRLAATRASKLTHQLLAFSRQQDTVLARLDLNILIKDLLAMLRRLIGETIRIDFSPDPALGPVMADGGQIEQVLMNLCLNARDAMPQGGVISISTENTRLLPGSPPLPPRAGDGGWALIQVSDDGEGLAPGTKDRVFEPYFTTKPVGKGSGLGLSTVFGIVEQHDGVIDLSSEPNEGAVLRIFLPQLTGD